MDFQLVCILLIFLVLFILESYEKMEGFTQKYVSPLNQERSDMNDNGIDLKDRENNFSNFTTIGEYPTIPLCNSCNLQPGEMGPPYLQRNQVGDESSSMYQTVTKKCSNIFGKNYNNLNKPFLVSGRSAGRTRQCRKLM